MNAADIAILAVLALSMLFGLVRGFVSEVLSLVCWVAALWVAWAFGDEVAGFYSGWLHNPVACIVAGYVTCFVGVLIVGAVTGWVVHRLMSHGGLRGGDRFLGLLFGLARGVLLVTFAVLMLGFTMVPAKAAWWRQSTLLPTFETAAGWVAQALPPAVTRYFESGGRSLPVLSRAPISDLRHAARRLADPASGSTAPAAAGTAGRAVEHGSRHRDVGQ